MRGWSNRNSESVFFLSSGACSSSGAGPARELAPTSTAASTFALACGSALCTRGACSLDADRLHEEFIEAIGRDPSSRELVGNLQAFYAAAQRGDLRVRVPADELARQRALTQSIMAGMD